MRIGGSRIAALTAALLAGAVLVGVPTAQGEVQEISRASWLSPPSTDVVIPSAEVRALQPSLRRPRSSGHRVVDIHFFRSASSWGDSPLTEALARDLVLKADAWALGVSGGTLRLRFASLMNAPGIVGDPCVDKLGPSLAALKNLLPVSPLPGSTEATWVSVTAAPESCGVYGWAYLGLPGMWLRLADARDSGGLTLGTFLHELGHNLGLMHSNGYGVNPSWSSTPSLLEQGDHSDVMGWYGAWRGVGSQWEFSVADLQAHNRNLLGFLRDSSIASAHAPSQEFSVAPVGSASGVTAVYLPWLDRSKFVIDYRPSGQRDDFLDAGYGSGSGVYVRLVDSGANAGPAPFTALDGTGAFTSRIGSYAEQLIHGYRVGQRVSLPDGSAVEVLSLGSDSARIRVTRPPDTTPPSIGSDVIGIKGCVDDPCTLPENTAKWGPSGAHYVFTTSTMPSPSDDVWLASARFTVSETVIAEVTRIPNGRDEETERVLETPIGVQVAPGTWDVRLEAVDLAGNEAAATATVIAPPAALPAGRWQSFGRNVRYTFPGWNRLADCAEGTTCIGLTVEAAVKPCKRGISVVVLAKGAGKKTIATMRKTTPALAKGGQAFVWLEAPVTGRVTAFAYQSMTCR